ncbi:hypothetical protein [Roseivivax jejudonensis]|uniref:hypothetical protein n=1 Tax=Roseivivax jejudonensis TaxID=1529041 RepID=UPI00117B607F|nr:hypothetical protein [Roseivivax jejudonensis]
MTAQTGADSSMAARGRQPGFQMGAEHRTKIANSKILKRLIDHAEGNEPEMTASEVNAGLSLLDRVMPKLKSVDDTGDATDRVVLKVQIGGE